MRNRMWGSVCALLLAACISRTPSPIVVPPAPVTAQAPAPAARAPTDEAAPAPAKRADNDAVAVVPNPALPEHSAGLAGYLAMLRGTSCPAAVRRQAAEAISIKAAPVPLQVLNPLRKQLDRLVFVAGFHLTSPNARFGGLSGIDVLDDGNLLAVSDQGDFVWLDLARDGATPVAIRIAAMRDADGNVLRAKADGDAEGLAVKDGLALVSFERNHRVLAFDLAACGAAARGAPINVGGHGAPLPQAFASSRIEMSSNAGAEPLGVTKDWRLLIGLETRTGEASPLSARPLDTRPEFDIRFGHGLPEFVGLDAIDTGEDDSDVRAFSLHRARNPLSPNAITIAETRLVRAPVQADLPPHSPGNVEARSQYRLVQDETRRLADMSLFLTIDNFEGIAAKELPDGRVRLYIISDNNFSASQRTLLMIFDLK